MVNNKITKLNTNKNSVALMCVRLKK